MGQEFELERFDQLLRAFVALSEERGDLQVRGEAAPPPFGFAVRLQPGPTSAGADLSLWLDGGQMTSWAAGGHPTVPVPERSFRLDLRSGFGWESLVFPYAEQLAHTMLQWMLDRVGGDRPRQLRAEAL